MSFLILSHVINVLVAGAIGLLLLMNIPAMTSVYGEATPARAILSSIYLSIAAASACALLFPEYSITIAKVLFLLQIFYKISTPFTVGTIKNPVVVSNLLISIVHTVSLCVILGYI
jgi:hypothetical protein